MKTEKKQVRVPATTASKLEWFDAVLADSELSAGAKNVAARLLRHHNDRTGQCNPSHQRIAEGLGLSVKHGRKHVCKLVAELKAGGWIEATGTAGSCEYRLLVVRAAGETGMSEDELDGSDDRQEVSPVEDGRCRLSAAGGVADRRQGVSSVGDRGVSSVGDTNHQREPATEPPKGTPNPTAAPVEAVSASVPSVPVNDNRPAGEGEVFSGWTIPGETMRQWVATFTDLNVRDELQRRARWYVANVPEERRLRVFEGKLRQWSKEARESRLSRKEAKATDVAAGVSRDNYGRAVAGAGWIENPRARPPGADRYWMPPAPGREKVFQGAGYFVTQSDFDVLVGRHPNLDLRTCISAYDREQGSVELGYDGHIAGMVRYLAALPGAQAA